MQVILNADNKQFPNEFGKVTAIRHNYHHSNVEIELLTQSATRTVVKAGTFENLIGSKVGIVATAKTSCRKVGRVTSLFQIAKAEMIAAHGDLKIGTTVTVVKINENTVDVEGHAGIPKNKLKLDEKSLKCRIDLYDVYLEGSSNADADKTKDNRSCFLKHIAPLAATRIQHSATQKQGTIDSYIKYKHTPSESARYSIRTDDGEIVHGNWNDFELAVKPDVPNVEPGHEKVNEPNGGHPLGIESDGNCIRRRLYESELLM